VRDLICEVQGIESSCEKLSSPWTSRKCNEMVRNPEDAQMSRRSGVRLGVDVRLGADVKLGVDVR
jgi:hypothetical protein